MLSNEQEYDSKGELLNNNNNNHKRTEKLGWWGAFFIRGTSPWPYFQHF